MSRRLVLALLFCIIHNFSLVSASEGDRSPFYENCVKNCKSKNCSEDGGFTKSSAGKLNFWVRLLRWSCREECQYNCMWRTVAAYEERNYPVPKFHGKWPFERIYGVQEPASAFASLLNLFAHVYMYWRLVMDPRFSIKETPLLLFWHLFFFVCVHGWMWSTIFHTRDTPFTEFMDYACALSMVLALFVAAVVRVFYWKRKMAAVILLFTAIHFIDHVRYLYMGNVDYEYNMTVNIVFGMVGTILWMLFALGAWCVAGTGSAAATRRYVWRLVVFCKLSGAAVLLELFDFPPYQRLWDAHALWHLSTAPLPLLFYRFVIDDLNYLQTAKSGEKKTEFKLA